MTIRALLVKPNAELEDLKLKGELEEFQALVGGYIEMAPIGTFHGATAYINEDGKYQFPELENHLATRFVDLCNPGFITHDFICGPMVIVGTERGEAVDIPMTVRSLVYLTRAKMDL